MEFDTVKAFDLAIGIASTLQERGWAELTDEELEAMSDDGEELAQMLQSEWSARVLERDAKAEAGDAEV